MTASRFDRAVAAFDEANDRDPVKVDYEGRRAGRELTLARRLAHWVDRLAPDASEPLRLAARCQHLRRFDIPRQTYPEGRAGYLRWRADLARFHAREAASILRECGYTDAVIRRVEQINRKQNLRNDPEVQVMEDALCLVFLENQVEEFSQKHDAAKMRDILRKTWAKMSARGREEALRLPYSTRVRSLIEQALAEG